MRSASSRDGSCPTRRPAAVPWRYASTSGAPKKVSPSPTRPASVWRRTKRMLGNSPSRIVSTLVMRMRNPRRLSIVRWEGVSALRWETLLVAEAHRIGLIGPERRDPAKPAPLVQGDRLALMDSRLETNHCEAVLASMLDQVVQHQLADP